jgi:hypothetical protein
LKPHVAADQGLGRKQSHDRERSDGFSRARLSHQAEHLTASNREAHVADGPHWFWRSRELYVQVSDFEQHTIMLAAASPGLLLFEYLG